ncbi:MAG: N-acetyltransferase family protein [Chitinophagales bacterium]
MIRKLAYADLSAVNEIYNQAVQNGFQTADLEEVDASSRLEWYQFHQDEQFPAYVVEINGKVIGWVSLSPYRKGRAALRFTAEVSYYIHQDFQNKGYGSELISFIIKASKSLKFKTLFAILLDRNVPSIRLLEKFNFEKWGVLPNVADFNGIECSHLYYGLRISK